ncbi:MAG: MBG domain-containing protein, partial [Thermoguttaceae bacterium]
MPSTLSGTYTLTVSGAGTTGNIPFNATAAFVQGQLQGLFAAGAPAIGVVLNAAGSYAISFGQSVTLSADPTSLNNGNVTVTATNSILAEINSAIAFGKANNENVVFQGGIQGQGWLGGATATAALQAAVLGPASNALFAIAAGNGDLDTTKIPALTMKVVTDVHNNDTFYQIAQATDAAGNDISPAPVPLPIAAGGIPANVTFYKTNPADKTGDYIYIGSVPGDGEVTEYVDYTGTTPANPNPRVYFEYVYSDGTVDVENATLLGGGVNQALSGDSNVITVGALEHGAYSAPPLWAPPSAKGGIAVVGPNNTSLDNAAANGVNKASYSNFGPSPNYMMAPTDAPAVAQRSADSFTVVNPAFSDKSPYPYFNGTSAANPDMAAMASLVWSADPNLTAAQVTTILEDTAIHLDSPLNATVSPVNRNDTYGYGLVDAGAAVCRAYALAQNLPLAGLFADNGYDYANSTTKPPSAPVGPLSGGPSATSATAFIMGGSSGPSLTAFSAPVLPGSPVTVDGGGSGVAAATQTAAGAGTHSLSAHVQATAQITSGLRTGQPAGRPILHPTGGGLVDAGFDQGADGLAGWTVSNSTLVHANGQNEVLLQEGATDVETDLSQDFVVPQGMAVLTFSIDATTFDSQFQNGETPDAFGVSLLDPASGQSLVPTVDGSTDSYYTQDLESGVAQGLAATGVSVSAGTTSGTLQVTLDTSALGGDEARLVFRVIAGSAPESLASITLRIGRAAATTVAVNPVALIYGTALNDAQLGGTATAVVNGQAVTVAGTFTYTSAAGLMLHAGSGQTEAVTFTPTDSSDYTSASIQVTINVAQATSVVVVNPVSLTYGTALANGQLGGTATWVVNGQPVTVAGAFTYTSAVGAVVGAGSGQTEAVTFTPTDGTDYSVRYVSGILNVSPAPLIITADSQSKTYDGKVFTAFTAHITGFVNGENATSAGVRGAAGFTGSAVTAVGVGSYTITPTAGSLAAANYDFTSFTGATLAISKAHLAVAADNQSKTYDGKLFTAFTAHLTGFANGEN